MRSYPAQPLDLMQYVNTKYHEPFIHELLEFGERPDEARLIRAVERLADVFPLVRCRYEPASNTFVENEAFSARALVRVDDAADRDALLTQSTDAGRQLLQLTLCRDSLVVTVSHLLCDGSGFKQLLYLLCALYNGREDRIPCRLMERGLGQLTEGLTGRMGITLTMLLSQLSGCRSVPVYARTEGERDYVLQRTLDAARMGAIHVRAKAQGATLNDVFLTAYARALSQLCGLGKVTIPCMADLRKYATVQPGIGNLTGTYNLTLRLRRGADFAATLRDVSEAMARLKRTKNDIAGPMLLVSKYESSTLEQFLKLYGGMETSSFADLTNLGALDAERLAFDGVTLRSAVGYSVLNKAPCFQVAISSFRGETTLSSLVRCGEAERQKADRVLEVMARELESFA